MIAVGFKAIRHAGCATRLTAMPSHCAKELNQSDQDHSGATWLITFTRVLLNEPVSPRAPARLFARFLGA
jgi:hypothetical protein